MFDLRVGCWNGSGWMVGKRLARGDRERERGREGEGERERRLSTGFTLMFAPNTSDLKAPWWMVASYMARIGEQGGPYSDV